MAEIVVAIEDVLQWFREKLALYDAKQITLEVIGEELVVNKGTVSRNRRRFLRDGTLATPFYESIHELLTKQRLADRQERERQAQEEADRIRAQAAKDKAARLEQEEADRLEAEQEAREAADREAAADRALRDASLKALRPWRQVVVAAGAVAPDDDTLYGDGRTLVAARVTQISYVDEGSALVALTPGDHRDACGHTSAVHRGGITVEQRQQPTLAPKGQPRPERIGYRDAYLVPRVLCPDAKAFYGDDYPAILEWQRLTEECRHLVEGPMPLVVQQETVEKAVRLLKLERGRYEFEGSIFDYVPDPDAWLRSLSLRSIAPVAGDAVVEGMKIVAKPVAAAAVGWAVWHFVPLEVWVGLWDAVAGFFAWAWDAPGNLRSAMAAKWTGAVGFLDEYKIAISAVVAAVVLLALGLWWLWPRAGDKEGALESRFIVAVGVVVAVPIVIFIVFQLVGLYDLNAERLQGLAPAMSESRVVTP